ncbi:MAG: hypothetical protein AAGB12_00370 [Pseudomonadota bacterium]
MDLSKLSQVERWHIGLMVKEAMSGSDNPNELFSAPLDFVEQEGRIKFSYPKWMLDIKTYLEPSHGAQSTRDIMLDLMLELMKPGGLDAIVNNTAFEKAPVKLVSV